MTHHDPQGRESRRTVLPQLPRVILKRAIKGQPHDPGPANVIGRVDPAMSAMARLRRPLEGMVLPFWQSYARSNPHQLP